MTAKFYKKRYLKSCMIRCPMITLKITELTYSVWIHTAYQSTQQSYYSRQPWNLGFVTLNTKRKNMKFREVGHLVRETNRPTRTPSLVSFHEAMQCWLCNKVECMILEKRVEFGQVKRRKEHFRRGDGEWRHGDGNREGISVRQLQTSLSRDKLCGWEAGNKTMNTRLGLILKTLNARHRSVIQ